MLPAPSRMRASAEFRDTLRHGVRAARPTVVVHARALQSPPSRVGFVVSRAVGGAVVRNRVKRRLRHLASVELANAQGAPVAVVVRALPRSAGEPGRLADDLHEAWRNSVRKLARPREGSGAPEAANGTGGGAA